MSQRDDQLLEAMVRIRALEPRWSDHMFVMPTDARLIAAARASGHVCRVVEEGDTILMCRDAGGDGSPWVPTTKTTPVIEWGYHELQQRLSRAVEATRALRQAARDARAEAAAARAARPSYGSTVVLA